MHHIIYGSRAARPLTDDELIHLLQDARRFNAAHEISGMLVYGNDQFMQIIEGEEAVITALYDRICRDPRHRQVVKYADKAIADRSFGDWAMAFEPLSPQQLDGLLSYLRPQQFVGLTPDLGPTDGLLLQMMRDLLTLRQP